ncbi:vomeronasal type-1 receptor 4-like [Carlito syrichta]|uniref:Vomeronasal type-1 receptor n=1 Tax=Carlito syrichta TaxID=1868482 RepID=A0A3Q0DF24_CARSF|nr:vomeronasal type-1 receptor 4-like [Carlito syrichta]
MANKDVVMGITFLSQTVVGFLGNSSLLYHYLLLYFTTNRIKFTDFILKHLMVANILTLLCKGVPSTMAALGLKDFLGDVGCKLLFYLHRVGRGVSFGSTCLLSIFQAITISPRNSRLAELKVKAPKYIGFSIYLSWILYMLVNIIFLMHITGKRSNKTITSHKDLGYCSSIRHDKTADTLYAVLLSFPDMLCLGLMICGSGFMVLVLYRHKQQVRQIHRSNVSLGCTPESRATKTVLLLMSAFGCFYALACIFQVCNTLLINPNWFQVNITSVISMCFPTVSPFLLMSRDFDVSRLCFSWMRNRKTPNFLRNM